MKIYKIISLVLAINIILMLVHCPSVIADDFNTLAFPSAEGYARYADGFRGGRVIEVTNLNDSGEGSLRWALEEETGPRIVVFKVGGVIELLSPIDIVDENGNVYIAGQTAPGDGITLINYPIRCGNTQDVIIRFIRMRIGKYNRRAVDGIWLSNCDQTIVDHCSVSWAMGFGIITTACENITIQNSIVGESLYYSESNSMWRDETTSSATLLSGNTLSFLNNLLINNAEDNLLMHDYTVAINERETEFAGKIDIRNNVVYNWYNGNSYGDIETVQFENNFFKKGEASITDTYFSLKRYSEYSTVEQKVYLSGNKLVDKDGQVIMDSGDEEQWKFVENTLENYTIEDAKSTEEFFESYHNTLSADEAYENVVKNVGATVPTRDYIDSRYIEELVSGKSTYVGSKSCLKGIIDSQEDAGGYPNETNFKGGEAPADIDHDGMSDVWETEHGLNPQNYADACVVSLSDEGYTNIELYINELAGDPVKYSNNLITPTPQASETIAPTSTPEESDYLIGDVDSDGNVNAADALMVLKHAAKIELLDDEKLLIADVESDEKIDAKDALEILKIAAKIE